MQKIFSPRDPNLTTSYNNIGGVHLEMGDYSKALPFCEHDVHIGQRSLSANHPYLQQYKEKLKIVKKEL